MVWQDYQRDWKTMQRFFMGMDAKKTRASALALRQKVYGEERTRLLAEMRAARAEMAVTLAGRTYRVNPGRQQVLNLLISTFENAVEKNHELHRANEQLTLAKEKLTNGTRRSNRSTSSSKRPMSMEPSGGW